MRETEALTDLVCRVCVADVVLLLESEIVAVVECVSELESRVAVDEPEVDGVVLGELVSEVVPDLESNVRDRDNVREAVDVGVSVRVVVLDDDADSVTDKVRLTVRERIDREPVLVHDTVGVALLPVAVSVAEGEVVADHDLLSLLLRVAVRLCDADRHVHDTDALTVFVCVRDNEEVLLAESESATLLDCD